MGLYIETEEGLKGIGGLEGRRARKRASRKRKRQRLAWAAAVKAGTMTKAEHRRLALGQAAKRKRKKKKAKAKVRRIIKYAAAAGAAVVAGPYLIKGAKFIGKGIIKGGKAMLKLASPAEKIIGTATKIAPAMRPVPEPEMEPIYEPEYEPVPEWEEMALTPTGEAMEIPETALVREGPVIEEKKPEVELVFTQEALARTKLFG